MTNAYCSNDKDLQDHRCICDLKQSSIQCSSLPKRCYTCYRYKTILFNKDVNILPAESFRYYDLFDYESNQSFTIQFAQIDSISSKTFSKILLKKDHTLVIQIAEYSSSSIPSKLFDQIKLESKSKFHLEIVNVTSSLLTIEPYAFHGIRHGFKKVDYGKNIYLNSSTFSNISQHTQSKLSIILRNSMHNLDIQRSSMMRIGYFHSTGILHTDSNAFVNVHRDHDSQFLFQIVNSSDFYLRYLNLTSLEIVDRMLTDEDLCRIHDIPSHIPVKLIPETSCSCSIFYLYRHLHRILNPLMLKDLTPLCYFHLSPDEIEHEERKCLFQKQISRCNQIEKYQNLSISPGKCYQNSIYSHKSSSFISLVLTLPAMSFILICIYLIATCKQRIVIFNLFHRRKRSMFNEDSYEQLTHFNKEKSMDIVMKFDTITKLTLPYLYTSESSNFIISNPIQLNTNPLDDIE
ncbi:hypothetical protein I4U23_027893 [Adineta vaga]|nr:hypothetical protein I4U23_027893 [Adineta vaga]